MGLYSSSKLLYYREKAMFQYKIRSWYYVFQTVVCGTFMSKVYYSPTNVQVIFLKHNIKIYIKIVPTCFGVLTPSSVGSSVLAKVTFVKKVSYGLSVYD